VRRTNNLTTFMCRLSRNSGASTSWSPKGLSRLVAGKLYLYMLSTEAEVVLSIWRLGYRLDNPGFESSMDKVFFTVPNTSRPVLRPKQWMPGYFSGGRMRRGNKVNHSPASSTKVKNDWNDTSTPHTCLHSVDREICAFTFIFKTKATKSRNTHDNKSKRF
jgi:hypothetical protein